MGRDTGFGLYGPGEAVRELYDAEPFWCADGADLALYSGGMIALDFLYWRNQHGLASVLGEVFGAGDSSAPKAIWTESGEFVGVEVDPNKFYAVAKQLASFAAQWDAVDYDRDEWLLRGLGIQMGRASYWNAQRREIERLGVKFFWYDSY